MIRVRILFLGILISLNSLAQGGTFVQGKLTKATELNKSVLLLVSDPQTSIELISKAVIEATQNRADVAIIPMDRKHLSNRNLVSEYELENATLPQLLVFSRRGQLIAKLTEQEVTADAIVSTIPTPIYGDMIYALGEGKSLVVLVSDGSFKSHSAALELCKSVEHKTLGRTACFAIDINDPEEKPLIDMLHVKSRPKDIQIVVLNSEGIATAKYRKLPTVEQLITAANKHIHTAGCSH